MSLATSRYRIIKRGGILLIRYTMMRRSSRWYFAHEIEWCVVEHIAIRRILDNSVEGSIAGDDNGDRSLDYGGTVPICKVMAVTKRL